MYSLHQRTARVVDVLGESPSREIVRVRFPEGEERQAINYRKINGSLLSGDKVLLNTTAVDLRLGTGGYHFVIAKVSSEKKQEPKVAKGREKSDYGHIMKMRYTPFQVRVLSVEEKKSPYHRKIMNFRHLNSLPVVILPLHSLLAPLAISFKTCYPEKRLIYIMTEGGCLPLELSCQVDYLKQHNFLDQTITIGQAFGGDLEAVNIFSGLAAAREAGGADLVAVGMGPGLAGTGTKLGFSGMENVFVDYAVKMLQGRSLVIPRISFAADRERHFLISHHTITTLQYMIGGSEVVFPENEVIVKKLRATNLSQRHHTVVVEYNKMLKILQNSSYQFESMGRTLDDDPLFFVCGSLPVLRYERLIEE
ncbi:MAG: DUF3866 family protein [Bacillota bacterium]